jgi:uncharacterized protein YgbK (DUF1537 family)
MLLGCIGDDFTGSSDLANTLAKQGMRTVQYTGTPSEAAADHVEAGVIALKSRSICAEDAVAQSLSALQWLQSQGCTQFLFKYCSTFDSTADGNIGPVTDALTDALDASQVVVCPAFPGTGRTVYQGHLFVNDTLLSESGMQHHPITPMTDPDLRRVLAAQSRNSVGHVSASDVFAGSKRIAGALQREAQAGHRLIIVDALRDEDLLSIGAALNNAKLVTGGSGIALGLPGNFAARQQLRGGEQQWAGEAGKCVALSGSCSNATRAQVAQHKKVHPCFEVTAEDVIEQKISVQQIAAWAMAESGLPLIFSSADPVVVEKVQQQFGREASASALESFFAELAIELVAAGATKILSAGGETSGAIVEGLKLKTLEIGPEIDPGVPALRAGSSLVLALKSGNFGAPDFFVKAADVLSADS